MSDAVSTTGILIKRKPILAANPTITSSSVANPSVITTSAAHGLSSGDTVNLSGHTGSTPALAGPYLITVISPTTFSIRDAVTGVGVNVTVGGTGGTVVPDFTSIGELTNVTPPGFERNKIPTSIHNEGRETNVLGMLLQKDAAFTINYVGTNLTHVAVLADIIGNVKNTWQVALPSGITYTAAARVQKFMPHEAPMDAVQGADCAITWAEPIVHAVAA